MSSPDEEFNPKHPESETTRSGLENLRTFIRQRSRAILFALILTTLLGILALASATSVANRPLYPVFPTVTSIPQEIVTDVTSLSFTELNANPGAYQDQRIQVSGDYTPLSPPDCQTWTGVSIRWSLVSEGLQLNATGFESIVGLIEPGTNLTVVGFWRLYQGPLGCGKEPAPEAVWYLEVQQVVEPNPLIVGGTNISLTVIANSPLPTLGVIEALTTPTPSLTPSPTETIQALPTEPISGIGTPGLFETPTETVTLPFPGTVTNTPDPNSTPTPEQTPGANVTPGSTATISGLATETPGPGLPTSTPSGTGYPIDATNTPTGGYP